MIANRGEIVSRIARTARRHGHRHGRRVLRARSQRGPRRRRRRRRRPRRRGAGRVVPARRRDHRAPRSTPAATRCIPATASSPRTPAFAAGGDRRRADLGRPDARRRSRLLGDKVAAKRVAIEAGVPTTPIIEVDADLDPAVARLPAARQGRRRRRRARHADRALSRASSTSAIGAASREAQSAFGDGTVFLEPYIEGGRHVEVQIMGDAHGNVVHFGERECSIQRRNQKIVEEAPSPGITDEVRAILHDGALALARACRLPERRHGRVHGGRSGGRLTDDLLPRGQHAAAGRAPRHRAGHAARSGRAPVARRGRRAAGHRAGRDRVVGHAIEVRLVAEDPARRLAAVDRRGRGVGARLATATTRRSAPAAS